MNLRTISRNVGYALSLSAFFMFISILVSIANGNDSALAALLISFSLTFVVSLFPFIFVRKASAISLQEGYMIIVLSWFLSFLFGMLPYALWGDQFSLVNAWFESVSGYTTTGATILTDIEDLPQSLLFWRSSTHFIGGLGVVVFILLILPPSSPLRLKLTNMELSALIKDEHFSSRTNKVVYLFASVYIGLNLAATICYYLAGMNLFDAVNHAFSCIATGGFSTKGTSIAAFNSTSINIITIIFMFLASLNFGLIYAFVVTRSLKVFNNSLVKFYLGSLALLSFIIFWLFNINNCFSSYGESLMQAIFHAISFVSCTGYAIGDNTTWPRYITFILLLFALPGGMVGSTAGGIKVDRFFLLLKSLKTRLITALHPTSIMERETKDWSAHFIFIGIYFFVIMMSYVAFLMMGVDGYNSMAAVISFMNNIGPACCDTMGTMGGFDAMPVLAKILGSFLMFLGRVEIFPVLAVLTLLFYSKRNL